MWTCLITCSNAIESQHRHIQQRQGHPSKNHNLSGIHSPANTDRWTSNTWLSFLFRLIFMDDVFATFWTDKRFGFRWKVLAVFLHVVYAVDALELLHWILKKKVYISFIAHCKMPIIITCRTFIVDCIKTYSCLAFYSRRSQNRDFLRREFSDAGYRFIFLKWQYIKFINYLSGI